MGVREWGARRTKKNGVTRHNSERNAKKNGGALWQHTLTVGAHAVHTYTHASRTCVHLFAWWCVCKAGAILHVHMYVCIHTHICMWMPTLGCSNTRTCRTCTYIWLHVHIHRLAPTHTRHAQTCAFKPTYLVLAQPFAVISVTLGKIDHTIPDVLQNPHLHRFMTTIEIFLDGMAWPGGGCYVTYCPLLVISLLW